MLAAFPSHHGGMTDDRDYPQMAAARGRVEPAPRRVRGYLGHQLVFDTTAARYVWEVPYYPQYYIPLDRRARGVPARRGPPAEGSVRVRRGLYSLVGDGLTHETAARVFDDGTARRGHGPLRMGSPALVRGGRADLRTSRATRTRVSTPCGRTATSRVELDGVVLADTHVPVLLFETGLPTRYYIDPTDVAFEHLEPSATRDAVPL